MDEPKRQLVRGLTATDTTALVVGTVIGSGVFLKTAVMTQDLGTPVLVLAAWVAAGLLSLAGALTYAELGAMLPAAGGEYVYLRKSYGETAAFLFGWQRFIVAGSASIASLGSGFAIFLAAFLPLNAVWVRRELSLLGQTIDWQFGPRQVVAVGAILFLSVVELLRGGLGREGPVGPHRAEDRRHRLRRARHLPVLGLGGLVPPAGAGGDARPGAAGPPSAPRCWRRSGPTTAGTTCPWRRARCRTPGRNIPRALIGGMLVVMAIYCLANLAYFYALPVAEVVTSNSTRHRAALPVASKAASTFLGEYGGKLVAVAFVVSAFGALNGSILSNARVPYAMARDRLFFAKMADLSERTRVPVWALGVQAVWSSVLALSGTFDQLTDSLLFASWIFYGLVTSFGLRAAAQDAARRRGPTAPSAIRWCRRCSSWFPPGWSSIP